MKRLVIFSLMMILFVSCTTSEESLKELQEKGCKNDASQCFKGSTKAVAKKAAIYLLSTDISHFGDRVEIRFKPNESSFYVWPGKALNGRLVKRLAKEFLVKALPKVLEYPRDSAIFIAWFEDGETKMLINGIQ